MTDLRKKDPLFVSAGFGVDFLMSLVFFFGLASLGIFLLCYVHVVRVPYQIQFAGIIGVFIFVCLRRLRIGFFPMIFLHVLATAIFLSCTYVILGSTEEAQGIVIYLGCLMVVNIVYSIAQRTSRALARVRNDGLLFLLVLHVILFAVFVATGFHFRLNMITTNAVLMVVCFFVARQFDTFEAKYYHNIHSATQPVHSIKKQNRMLVIIVVAGIVFAVIMLKFFPTDDLSRLLSHVLLYLGRLIGKLLPGPGKESKPEAMEAYGEERPEEEEFGKSTLVNVLAAIAIIIIAVLIFIFIVTMIIELVKKFKKIQPVEKTVENDAVVDIIESVESKKKKKSSSRHDFGQGYEREIRKKYYQRVMQAIKSGLPIKDSSSPHQIEKIIKRSGDPSISELTSQYESVRYNKK
ncbi:MAG: hypothetical protein J5752_09890 [Clostridiales bacterium]|nr:hypothetical protein [Clostridiales bacterium]